MKRGSIDPINEVNRMACDGGINVGRQGKEKLRLKGGKGGSFCKDKFSPNYDINDLSYSKLDAS